MIENIRKIVVLLFVYIGQFVSYICMYDLVYRVFNFFIKCFYTGIMKRFFKSFGSESLINSKFRYLKGLKYISIGKNTVLEGNIELTAYDSYRNQKIFQPSIIIGDNCHIGMNAKITAIHSVVIGNGVLTGRNVLITDNAHGESVASYIPPGDRCLVSKGSTVIEDNVWLGDNVSILPGVHVGKGCIVGTNSVVTKNVPPYCVVGGIPAKVLKNMK